MSKTKRAWFRTILNCENLEGRKKLITEFFDSLSNTSSSGLTKTFMEFLKFVQEENPQLYEQVCEHLEEELHLESDIGEFGFGGDWWKAAGESDDI